MTRAMTQLVRRFLSFRSLAKKMTLCTVLMASGVIIPNAEALNLQQITLPQLKQNVTIDALGNGNCTLSIKMPTSRYSNFKANNPNFAVLLRRWQLEPQWTEISDVQGNFDDSTDTLSISYRVHGLARMIRAGRWELQLPTEAGLQVVSTNPTSTVLSSIVDSDSLGQVVLQVNINAPEGARNLQVASSPLRVGFEADAPTNVEGSNTAVDCVVAVQPSVMSSLGKMYSNSKFAELWTARSVFKNQGDQPVFDYQVRFRVPGYTHEWSGWKRTFEVRPGQTVVDPFFADFDVVKLASLTGPRSTNLEIEYQYRRVDGQVVQESSSQNFQMLGRNEVFYSTFSHNSAVGWYDMFNLGPYLVGAFVTHEDPIIQQVAGWVSQQAGGPAAAAKDEDAIRFMRALYDFCRGNKIAYQSPPDGHAQSQIAQHLKYGRDVLRNRAGTCIDLAILYSSVCEAAGLRPRVYLIPGHAFPVVALPESGKLIPIETTLFCSATFDEAVKRGEEEVQEVLRTNTAFYAINTMVQKDQGVFGLELPELPPSTLDDWGIKPVTSTSSQGGSATVSRSELVGTWIFRGTLNNEQVAYGLSFDANGGYICVVNGVKSNGQKYEKKEQGKFELGPGVVIFHRPSGSDMARKFEVKDGQLHLTFEEIKTILVFSRVNE